MSQDKHIPADFAEWVVRSLDGTITTEQFAMLDHEITTNNAARAYYFEFITTYVGLVDLAGVLPKAADIVGEKTMCDTAEYSGRGTIPLKKEYHGSRTPRDENVGALHFEPGMSEEEKLRRIEQYARQQLAAFLMEEQSERREPEVRSSGWDLSLIRDRASGTARWVVRTGIKTAKTAAVLSLAALVVLAFALYVYANRTVATLVSSVDARWNVPIEKDARLRPRLMRLEQGYAHIMLNKGAEVILQAPSTFKVQTPNKMFLESGWMTAKVPRRAMGFIVKTPESSVVDFGTEFGLLVGAGSSAEVHVFDGSIGLASVDSSRYAMYRQKLEKGEAATISSTGRIEQGMLTERPRLFTRSMPSAGGFGIPGKRLDLADMIGGGNGLGIGTVGQGIDPSTGEIMMGRRVLHGLDKGFMKVSSLSFIDGVFVPDSNDGPVVITSTGVVFDECPKTLGKCYEIIINGAMFRIGSSLEVHLGCLAGRTYGTKANPSIGMHPNAGITFDLDKIRSSMPDVNIDRFRALCGVSETAVQYAARDSDPREIKVDFWVLVDGQTRFSERFVAVPPQSEQIDIPIDPNDRFLTLATTNPGNYSYCWGMFAEPMLELTTKKP